MGFFNQFFFLLIRLGQTITTDPNIEIFERKECSAQRYQAG